jgi:hypothetical protein
MKTSRGEISKWLVPAITVTLAAAYGIFSYSQGVTKASDTITYSHWADTLISSNFNYLQMSREISFVVSPLLYSGWVTVVALFKSTLGPRWPVGIVLLNYCLTLLAVWGTLNLIKRMTQDALSILLAGALLLIAFDLFSWIHFVLSDSSFMAITFAVYYLFYHLSISMEKRSTLVWRLSLCIALVLLAICYRPTGLPLIIIGGLVYLSKVMLKNGGAIERARLARRGGAALCLFGIAAIVLHAYFMKEPSSWPLSFASSWIQRLSEEYHQGYVVPQRPETYVLNPASMLDYVFITLKKLVYFFSPLANSFSFAHKVANLAFFVPVYLLALSGALKLFRSSALLAVTQWWAGWIALLWTASFALFHAVQQIDYDWRYRLPCLLPLIVLSVSGFRSLTLDHRIVEKIRATRLVRNRVWGNCGMSENRPARG